MGYRRAEEILPNEIIELIQQYVDGTSIYIPRKTSNRQGWGTGTQIRQDRTGRFTRSILREAGLRNWPANTICQKKAYSVS